RQFGFPMERIRQLVGLWRAHQPSREVKQVALKHMAELERRIVELTAMRDALKELADHCRGDHQPECPILRDLAGSNTAGTAAQAA
ncbi:MAG: MerR family DNA-binding protein, partial [Rhodopila sp.]|nr:MerR family DNA-binding protein [Rhodopila sp.]